MSIRDESCNIGTVQSCQQYELIVSWHVGLEEATAGGGFIPHGAAWSSAGVLDLVIRLWGRATQRKSLLNSEEALKACSSLHQKRREKKFFFSDAAGQYTKYERPPRSFDLNPVSHCETSDWTIFGQGWCFLQQWTMLQLGSHCHHCLVPQLTCKNTCVL